LTKWTSKPASRQGEELRRPTVGAASGSRLLRRPFEGSDAVVGFLDGGELTPHQGLDVRRKVVLEGLLEMLPGHVFAALAFGHHGSIAPTRHGSLDARPPLVQGSGDGPRLPVVGPQPPQFALQLGSELAPLFRIALKERLPFGLFDTLRGQAKAGFAVPARLEEPFQDADQLPILG